MWAFRRNPRQKGGARLGLSIIKAIVKAHGGHRVESVQDKGSRFLIKSPVAGEESE
jgi:signal transduction histidine kinase